MVWIILSWVGNLFILLGLWYIGRKRDLLFYFQCVVRPFGSSFQSSGGCGLWLLCV